MLIGTGPAIYPMLCPNWGFFSMSTNEIVERLPDGDQLEAAATALEAASAAARAAADNQALSKAMARSGAQLDGMLLEAQASGYTASSSNNA